MCDREILEQLDLCDRAISAVQKICPRKDEEELVNLYRNISATDSLRVFGIKACSLVQHIQSSSCGNCYCHGYVVRGMMLKLFCRHFEDSDAVGEILKFMAKHFKPFNFFFAQYPEYLRLEVPSHVFQQRKSKGLESFSFLGYFLHHANRSRLTIDGMRYISLLSLAQSDYPKCCVPVGVHRSLPTLLQYGISLADEKISNDHLPIYLLVTLSEIIRCGVNNQQWDRTTLLFRVKASEFVRKVKFLSTFFCNLLRDKINPQEATFLLAGRHLGNYEVPQLETLLPFYDQLFPGHMFGRKTPSPLRSMCRHFIRRILFDNWNLPDGIESLPIPEIMRDYVNMLYD